MQNKRPIINPTFPECPIRNVLAYDCNGFAIAVILTLGDRKEATIEDLLMFYPEISKHKLSIVLEYLMEDGIISADNLKYHLSNKGESLLPILKKLSDWIIENKLKR